MKLPSARRWAVAFTIATAAAMTTFAPAVGQDATPATADGAPPATTSAAALALEATIPTSILGLDLVTISFSGDDILARAGADDPVEALERLAADANVAIGDLVLASGTGDDGERFIGVLAARLGGVPAADFADALTPLILETADSTPFVTVTIGDDEVTQVGPGSGLTGDALAYVVERGDTTWYVVTDVELLPDVLGALP